MNVIGTAHRLTALCADVFECLGSVPEKGCRVAVSLVDANLAGHDSHGVNRVPLYIDWVRSGVISPNQSLKRVVDTPALAVVDGGDGFGQTIAPLAVAQGIERAKTLVFPRSPSATLATSGASANGAAWAWRRV
jgi:uncharacterized oxidoreductase